MMVDPEPTMMLTWRAYCRSARAHGEHRWSYGGFSYRCPGVTEVMRLEHVNVGVDYGESKEDDQEVASHD
jgi:hypothetical protein